MIINHSNNPKPFQVYVQKKDVSTFNVPVPSCPQVPQLNYHRRGCEVPGITTYDVQ